MTTEGKSGKLLKVTIVAAHGLRKADPGLFAKSDPYCVCEVVRKPQTKFHTHTFFKTLDPVWDCAGEIQGFSEQDTLRFSVYDQDEWPKEDDFLGRVLLPGSQIIPDGFKGRLTLQHSGTAATLDVRVDVVVQRPSFLPPELRAGSTQFFEPEDDADITKVESTDQPAIGREKFGSTAGIPQQLTVAGGDSLGWLNEILGAMWEHIDEAIEKLADQKLGKTNLPIHISKCKLGDAKPELGPVRVFKASLASSQGIRICLGIVYHSDVDIAIGIGPASIGVRSLRFSGELIVRLRPLIGEVPVVGGIVVYFLDQPELDLEFTGLASVADAPGVRGLVRNAIQSAIASAMVLPNAIALPLATEQQGVNLAKLNKPPPIGVLRVTAKHGTGLIGSDGRVTKPSLSVSVADQTRELFWGDQADFIAYDWDSLIRADVFDESESSWFSSSAGWVGRIQPLSVHEALLQSDQLFGLRCPSSGDSAPQSQSEVCMQFQWLNILVAGEASTVKNMLIVEVHQIFLPAKFGNQAKLSACVLNRTGIELHEKETRIGIELKPKALENAVDNAMVNVAKRCHALGLDSGHIAYITGLGAAKIAGMVEHKNPAGAAPVMKTPVPETPGIMSTLGVIFCRRRAKPLQLPARVEVDLEEAQPLASMHDGRDTTIMAKTGSGVEEVLLALEVESTLHLLLEPSDTLGASLKFALKDPKNMEIATASLQFSTIQHAENCTMPGPLWLAPVGGGAGIEAQVHISMRGLKVST